MKKFALLILGLVFITTYGCDSNTTKIDNEDDAKAETVSKNESTEKAKGAIHLTKQDFLEKVMNYEKNQEWIFEGDKPCIIDFYADWCRPCKIAGPILEELAIEYDGKINVYKINTQKEQELASAFGIQSIPAFLLCPVDGKPQMSAGIGRTPEETKQMFKQMIDEFLLKN